MHDHSESEQKKKVSRRSLLVASAWATPIIMTTVAVPLAAASIALEIRAVSGDVEGNLMTFSGVSAGDSVPLVFEVTQSGAPYNGVATSTLSSAAGIATWDESVDVGGDTATAPIDGGILVLPVTVVATGAFTLQVTTANASSAFSVSLVA